MTPFDLGQITQEFANVRITYMLDGSFIEATSFELHHLDLLPDVIDAQWTDQPDRAALNEALDVMPANQGNVLAEAAHGFRTKPESEVVHTSDGDHKIDTPKLGDVGGTIVAETFAGMMLDDRNSFWNLWPKWEPDRALGGRGFDLRRFIRYALG